MNRSTPTRWLMTPLILGALVLTAACGDSDESGSSDPCRLCDVQVLYQLPCGPVSRADCEMDCQELTGVCPALWESLTACVVANPQVSCDTNSDLNFESCTAESQAVNTCADNAANNDADVTGGDTTQDVGTDQTDTEVGTPDTSSGQDANGGGPDA